MTNSPDGFKSAKSQILDPYVSLFALTLLLSAALTFTIQPMVGKMLLPLVGGTPSGWLVTMVFFQMALLAGYVIAHLLSRFSVLVHMSGVIALLMLGLLMFPLHLKPELIENSGLPESMTVLVTLVLSLTPPCVALFTLSPSLQRLFEAGSGSTRRDPYFLFAASNLGSLGGLVLYPLLIEHISGLAEQTDTWQQRYKLLIVLCVLCLAIAKKHLTTRAAVKPAAATPLTWRTRGWWLLLAFIPSSLMLGVTAHVTSDLGGVPFFWVLPLALYLLTFILAFAQREFFSLATIDFLRTASIAILIAFFVKRPSAISISVPEQSIFPLAAFFLTALYCHVRLASSRPDTSRLTEFYLWVAVGGALGGLFSTFVAPFVFPLPVEFILVAVLSCLLRGERRGFGTDDVKRVMLVATVAAAGAALLYGIKPFPATRVGQLEDILATCLLLGSLVIISLWPRYLAGFSLILGAVTLIMQHGMNRLDVHRDFFGVLRVFETTKDDMTVRTMFHGSTLHGLEQVAPKIDTTPHSYYEGSLEDLINLRKPKDVGILGMGAGIILCYQAPGRHYTVYEIDPAVPVLAAKWFDYMRNCGDPDFRIGDGRRMLAAEERQEPHDLLVVDVFTSDAIPIHLLTKEAFGIYFKRLKSDGLLAIHISNRFYDLRGQISSIVAALGFHALFKEFRPPVSEKLQLSMHSHWVVVARTEDELAPLRNEGWVDLPPPTARVWTDDFSDALSALKIFQPQTEIVHAQAH
ncbi:MAG: fused MFS/spermidine synthase [Pseudomonadota bacterium]|nr:fused MFS/spermidine synthase [Pseudomonadota bacterium]